MKGIYIVLLLVVCSLGKIEGLDGKGFLKGELEVKLEETGIEAQGSELEPSGNVTSAGVSDNGNDVNTTESGAGEEKEEDTFMYGVIIDVVIIVLILVFILYLVVKNKSSKPEGQAYARAP